jgi:hypothetical protein
MTIALTVAIVPLPQSIQSLCEKLLDNYITLIKRRSQMKFKVSVEMDIDIDGMTQENWNKHSEMIEEEIMNLVFDDSGVFLFDYKPVEEK